MNFEFIYLIQIICSLLLFVFFIISTIYLFKIENKALCYITVSTLFTAVAYNILVSLVRQPTFSLETVCLLSQFVFFSSYVSFSLFLIFSLIFLRDYKEFHRPIFWLLILLNCVFMALSFTDYLVSGAEKIGSEYHPISGELRPLATLFFPLQIAYITYLFVRSYKKTQENISRRQITLVGVTILTSLLGSIIFNAVIPTLLGTSKYNFISQFSYVGMAYIFLYLNLNYTKSFAKDALKGLLKQPYFQSVNNILTLQNLLQSASESLQTKGKNKKMIERFAFHPDSDSNHESKVFFLSNFQPEESKKTNGSKNNLMEYFPVTSYIESLQRLERENLAMGLQMQLSHEILHEHVPEHKLANYEKKIETLERTLGLTLERGRLSALEHSEKREILKCMTKNNFRKIASAKELGITLNTLKSKIKKYEIKPLLFPQKQMEHIERHIDHHKLKKIS